MLSALVCLLQLLLEVRFHLPKLRLQLRVLLHALALFFLCLLSMNNCLLYLLLKRGLLLKQWLILLDLCLQPHFNQRLAGAARTVVKLR
eukprot:Skav219452  [mRNA]  locus=scaffold2583:28749:31736:- [translate_table: standard]